MNTLKVGLIPSPDLPAIMVAKITEKLENDLHKSVDPQIDWQFEIEIDLFTGTAEYVNDSVDSAYKMKEKHQWDYAICITDLPSFSEHKVVIMDVSSKRNTAFISLPSFGIFPLKKRIRKAITFIIDLLHNGEESRRKKNSLAPIHWKFLFSKIKRVIPEENEYLDTRYILDSRVVGWLRVLLGMVLANRPWSALPAFKKILTLAFATGTYISIFSTPWQLSVAYGPLRFIILMLLTIFGMVLWITFAHKLWEKSTSISQSQYRNLYNVTTMMTLVVITIINYVALYALFLLSISLFVPEGIFDAWTNTSSQGSFYNYMRLAWLATSLGLLAGAVGATAEKEEKIRDTTYSYRQLNRYYEMEQLTKEEKTTKEESKESYGGTWQTHRESDTHE